MRRPDSIGASTIIGIDELLRYHITMDYLSDLLSFVPVSEAAKVAVVTRLQEPHRRYHNLDHPVEMWRWHRQFTPHGSPTTVIVASFCLYHDAIYDTRASDNEEDRSATSGWRTRQPMWSRDIWCTSASSRQPIILDAIEIRNRWYTGVWTSTCYDWLSRWRRSSNKAMTFARNTTI